MPRSNAPAADPSALDAERLFRALADARGLVVAVSGGPDSTALMVLLAEWPRRPPVLVVTIDHGLRREAEDEARLVAENAVRLGLPSRIMRPPRRPSGGNLQDWARRARYGLLVSAAEEAGYNVIVTAHHRDDQAETFLLRLSRGSGVYGLAAMAFETEVGGIRLVRPLLDTSREDLAGIAAARGLAVAADPGNADTRFARVRLRGLMPALAELGLTTERLAGTAARLKRAADALDHYSRELLREHFEADAFGAASGPASAFAQVPEEVALRALTRLLTAAGGAEYPPRLDRTEALLTTILQGGSGFKRTLHGATISLAGGRLVACREWGRQGIAAAAVQGSTSLIWDRRFEIRVPSGSESLSIGPLGRSARRLRSLGSRAAAIRTLPGLFAGESLLAAPKSVVATDDGPPLAPLAAECIVGRRIGIADGPAPRSP